MSLDMITILMWTVLTMKFIYMLTNLINIFFILYDVDHDDDSA